MGCDIHLYLQKRKRNSDNDYDSQFRTFIGNRSLTTPRNYNLFAKMAKVRGNYKDSFNPRGFPDDAINDWTIKYDYCLDIEEPTDEYKEHTCTKEDAERWVIKGRSKFVDDTTVTNPDWHSASWLTFEEFKGCVNSTCDDDNWSFEYFAYVAAMAELETLGYETRVVFWFDN